MKLPAGFRPGLGMNLFSLTAADSACYTYAMVNRQDALYSLGSPEIGRHLLLVEIIFVGTKLAIDRSRPKTTTGGIGRFFEALWPIRPAN